MADERAKPDARVISAYLDDVDLELDAAKRLILHLPNRFAAFHLEQAAGKLVQAVRLSRGLGVMVDHELEALVDELPADDPWRTKLRVLEPLATHATTYRDPSPTEGEGGPSNDEVLVGLKTIAGLCTDARAELLTTTWT